LSCTQEQIEIIRSKNKKQTLEIDFDNIQFWCSKKNSKQSCCLTHLVDLPRHPATFQESSLMPYQEQFFSLQHKRNPTKYHINKARQIGWTETILRIIQYECFHKYRGGKIIILTATRFDTGKDIFQRFKQLFNNITYTIKKLESNSITLTNNTQIVNLPANPEAVTGLTKIKCVFMDECSKWNLKDDQPVINAILPIVRTNQSDLFMISTPKGPRGFFFNIETSENDFYKLKYNIYEVQGLLYSKTEIEQMINSSVEDPNQEYLNQYVAGRNAIFQSDFFESNEFEGIEI